VQRAIVHSVIPFAALLASACATTPETAAAPASGEPAETSTLLLHVDEGAEPMRIDLREGRVEAVRRPGWKGPLMVTVRRLGEMIDLVVKADEGGQLRMAGTGRLLSGDTLTIRSPRSFRGGFFGGVEAVRFEYVGPPEPEI